MRDLIMYNVDAKNRRANDSCDEDQKAKIEGWM